jgi:hypothetical protein
LDVEEDGSHALLTLLFGEAASSIDSDGTEQSRELSNSEEIARFQATEKCREDRPPVSADGLYQTRTGVVAGDGYALDVPEIGRGLASQLR